MPLPHVAGRLAALTLMLAHGAGAAPPPKPLGPASIQGPVPPVVAVTDEELNKPVWRANLGTRFYALGIDGALARAMSELKLVAAYVHDGHDERMDATWRNPTLASYLDWRCITIDVDARDNPGVLTRLRLDRRDLPAVVVLLPHPGSEEIVGKVVRPWNALSDEIATRWTPAALRDTVPDIVPTATNVLFQVDLARERLAARDPAWAAASDRANPMPEAPPDDDPLHQTEDENANAVHDPGPDDRGWRRGTVGANAAPAAAVASVVTTSAASYTAPYDVMERLSEARAAVRANDQRQAIGMYTWLWERGEALDPACRAFRRCILPQEMKELAEAGGPARQRFSDVRDQLSRKLLFVDFGDLMVWFTLNEICGEAEENVHYLDLYTNDRDEAAMLPRAWLAAYRLMGARDRFIDPWKIDEPSRTGAKTLMPSDPDAAALAHVRGVAKRLAEPRKSNVPADDHRKLQTFRRDYLIDETARLHVALLREGRDEVAYQAIDAALAALPSPADRAQLLNSAVFCALAVEESRPERHARYLADAAGLGFGNMTLELRLKEARSGPPAAR